MSTGWARVVALCGMLLLWAGSLTAQEATPADLCILAARDASVINAVPLSVLVAVSLTETGRSEGGQTRPWPWTVNVEGEGHWFPDRAAAVAFAEAQHAAGRTSFDVGCFQVNYRWHGENFVSIEQMFDPLANATYAAGFLARLQTEQGDWSAAAGAYHSRTPEYAERYRARFDQFLAEAVASGVDDGSLSAGVLVADAGPDEGAPVMARPRVNNFPLLRPGAAPRGLGSLVPLGGG